MARLLPGRIPGHLLRMRITYEKTGRTELAKLLSAAKCHVVEDVDHDGYDNSDGHDVLLYLPLDVITEHDIQSTQGFREKLREDLRALSTSVQNEYVHDVHLELDSESDDGARNAVAISERRLVDPATVDFWKPGMVRLFVSHRDAHKKSARDLAKVLENYGISSFVAHDTITPMSEWRKEIMKGLETMELMLLFLTDDFDDSSWTNQEVGFALGRGIPVVSLKLGHRDPPGFVSHVQAQRGRVDDPDDAAAKLFPVLGKALGKQDRMSHALIVSFVKSPSYNDAKDRFEALKRSVPRLTPDQTDMIREAYNTNSQLNGSGHLNNQRLVTYLRDASGNDFVIENRRLQKYRRRSTEPDDDIPF